jgi:hypothetical protein
VTRGVLLGVVGNQGLTTLPDAYCIPVGDLQACRVPIRSGHAVIVRTGRCNVYFDEQSTTPRDRGRAKPFRSPNGRLTRTRSWSVQTLPASEFFTGNSDQPGMHLQCMDCCSGTTASISSSR